MAYAEETIPTWPISYSDREKRVAGLIERYGAFYGATDKQKKTALAIVECENSELDPSLQSYSYYKDGTREESYGLSQIHLLAHKDISKEQATDPNFSIDFLMREITAGHEDIWSCYSKINRSGDG